MSIPKEPRQLMINLMYLVLTALLALNVSAEVMLAFKTIDDSLQASNATTTKAIDEQQAALESLLNDESKKDFQPLGDGIKEIRTIVADFMAYVDTVKDTLIDDAGNRNLKIDEGDFVYYGTPKEIIIGKKNKDVTTKIMVTGGKGKELQDKIEKVNKAIKAAYEKVVRNDENAKTFGFRTPSGEVDTAAVSKNINALEQNISLKIDENWKDKADEDKENWADFRFRQMPLISVLPLLTKFQTDAKNAEALAVGKLSELAGGKEIVFNSFFPVINAKKAYVIKGEKFEADISLGAYSSDIPPENITLTVNGTRLKVGEDGKAKYSATASSTGTKSIALKAVVLNPLTKEESEGSSKFEYEVGVRSATVTADKMNVFYIGVDNPVSVVAAGIPSSSLKVNCNGCGEFNPKGTGKYISKPKKPGEATIFISGEGLPRTPYAFRVKRIPDPVARLGKKQDGSMGNGEFKAQRGVLAWLDNFDFDAKCNIQTFQVVKVPKRQDPIIAKNSGGTYNAKVKRLVSSAKPGDTYYFEDVKAKCPGDNAARKINSMIFKIK